MYFAISHIHIIHIHYRRRYHLVFYAYIIRLYAPEMELLDVGASVPIVNLLNHFPRFCLFAS